MIYFSELIRNEGGKGRRRAYWLQIKRTTRELGEIGWKHRGGDAARRSGGRTGQFEIFKQTKWQQRLWVARQIVFPQVAESAALTVRATSRLLICAAYLSLILWVSFDLAEILRAMCILAFVAVSAMVLFLPISTQFRLVKLLFFIHHMWSGLGMAPTWVTILTACCWCWCSCCCCCWCTTILSGTYCGKRKI